MDKISYIVILRALFLYLLVEKGWTVKRSDDHTFEITKNVKTQI
jgi:hypothetical protein